MTADRSGRWATVGPAVLVAALTVYLAFNSGGYFPGARSFAAIILAGVLIVWVLAAADPLRGLSLPLVLAAAALMLLGAWTLASADWSHSSSRAVLECSRVLLYLLTLLVFGSIARGVRGVRGVVWGSLIAMTAICVAGFLTRTLPDVFTIAPSVQNERLSYPIGYWNALGLAAAVGIVLSLHLAASEREPLLARVLGAGALPVLAATLLFTYSRGPIVAVPVGIVAYLLVARPRGLTSALLAAGPPVAFALVASYRADLLASKEPTTPAAAAQGHHVAIVVLICVVAAILLRRLLLPLDATMVNLRLGGAVKRRLAIGIAVVLAAGAVIVLVGTDATDRVQAEYKRFTRSNVGQTGDNRDRLTDPGIDRLDHWNIAVDAFADAPLRGQGAGTFDLLWDRNRPTDSDSEEGHSLYLEVLAELGVVGLVLLAVALLAVLAVSALRARRPERALYAAVFAAALTWALHAGIDWDWEVPAVTLWLFAAGGAVLAAPGGGGSGTRASWRLRGALVAGCVVLAVIPALVSVSQARLTQSLDAYARDDCRGAADDAQASLDVLDNRPQPYEVLAECYARARRFGVAEAMARKAVARDPGNWEYHFTLALVRAAAGRDPRPEARRALSLNPNEVRARAAVQGFRTSSRKAWRDAVAQLGLRVGR